MTQNLSIDPPGDGEEFERYCLWLAREKYGPDAFLYTRNKQNGIDIYWLRHGKYFVIQCKQRSEPGPAELIRSLEADFETARNYFGTNLEQFIFAATISLEHASKNVRRDNGNTESLLGAVGRLGSVHNVTTVCWHWDGIASDIADSPFLMAHLLGQEKGGELINEDFFTDQNKKYGSDIDLKKAFYGGKKAVQWCGITQRLDAPRQVYQRAKKAIESSFESDHPVAALIKGEGGSGKSILLRRLAHDLCTDYVVYWLESDIQSFLDCEWTYDVMKHSKAEAPSKYLIFLEDWYQHVENSGLQQQAADLLSKVVKNSHVRLVIGDRPAKQKVRKIYEGHISSQNIFELNASENIVLLETIFVKMPEWQDRASQEQIENAANATLFQLLFIFQYAEDMSGEIADIYKRIIASDCRTLLERHTAFWKGMAKAIFFYANLYVHEGVVVPVEFLRDLAAHFGECPVPERYDTTIDELVNDKILKKYFGLNAVIKEKVGAVNFFRFHHDTMADRGWMLLGGTVDERYDEAAVHAVLEYFKDKYPWIVGPFFFRQSRQPGSKGKEGARNYLNMKQPEKNHPMFTACLKKLGNEDLAKNKARGFLGTVNPWDNYQSFAFCLGLLKNEELAKNKAREFLSTDKPWEVKESFNASLNLLKDEKVGIDNALFILENRQNFNEGHQWTLIYRALNVLHDKPEHQQLISLTANEVIANRFKHMRYQYSQLLKIPLFHIPQWVERSKHHIYNWRQLNSKNPEVPQISRNTLYSITIGYGEKPELIEAMCLGLIRNWQFELRIKQKHQGYFIRSLAHPAIQQDNKLRQEIIAICKEILHCVTQPPLIINVGTRIWLEDIVERNQFPEWSSEQEPDGS